jgi:hypothetical protein
MFRFHRRMTSLTVGLLLSAVLVAFVMVVVRGSRGEPRPEPTPALTATSWFRATVEFQDETTVSGLEVDAAAPSLDRSLHTSIQLPGVRPSLVHGAEPFVLDANHVGVWVVLFDGVRSELRFLELDGSPERTLLKTDAVIHAAALDAAHNVVYASLLDPATRQHQGVARITLDDGRIEQLLPPRLGEGGLDPDGSHAGWVQTLSLTPNAGILVIETCQPRCQVEIVDLAGNETTPLDSEYFAGSLVGLTNEQMVFRADCDEAPCPLRAASLINGQSREILDEAGAALVTTVAGQSVVVYEEPDPADGELTIHMMESGQATRLVADVPAGWTLTTPSPSRAVDLPAGFVAFSPEGALDSDEIVVVDLRTGARVSDRHLPLSHVPAAP